MGSVAKWRGTRDVIWPLDKSLTLVAKLRLFNRLKRALRVTVSDACVSFRKADYAPKVFCIGYNKTGTTSVGKALEALGYRHSSYNDKVWRRYYLGNRIDKVIEYTARFESFDDLPWLKEDMIRLMDDIFPGSKFIYLERDEPSWKRSFFRFQKVAFGVSPDVNLAWQQYLAHESFVLNYFRERREKDLLILDVRDALGFKKLGEFLGRAAPRDAFPHYNSTDDLVARVISSKCDSK